MEGQAMTASHIGDERVHSWVKPYLDGTHHATSRCAARAAPGRVGVATCAMGRAPSSGSSVVVSQAPSLGSRQHGTVARAYMGQEVNGSTSGNAACEPRTPLA